MRLLIDIGNENAKWKLGDNRGTFPSERAKFIQNLQIQTANLAPPSGVLFVNVSARGVAEDIKAFAAGKWQIPTIEVVPSAEQCGVKNSYHNTSELGADRWAALIGARSICTGAAIIVDSGTAVTVDALAADGQFVGGSILPGFRLSRESLWRNASGIGDFERQVPIIPARSTAEAVSCGVVYSIAGGIDSLIRSYGKLIGPAAQLLITGGDTALITEYSSYEFEPSPNLVIVGLETIAETL